MAVAVAVLVGSLRSGSLNRRLARALEKAAPRGWSFSYPEFAELPPYNQDASDPLPESVAKLKSELADADAIIFVTPEYNRSVPGALKNAIDWASRPSADNPLAGKPTLVSGTSPGNISTAVAQQHLRVILGYLDAPVMGQPEVFIRFQPEDLIDEDGNVSAQSTREFLSEVMSSFEAWVETVRGGVLA